MIYRVQRPRPSATNSGAARRCRRDLPAKQRAADRLVGQRCRGKKSGIEPNRYGDPKSCDGLTGKQGPANEGRGPGTASFAAGLGESEVGAPRTAPATRSLRAERRKGRRRREPPSPGRRLRRSARSIWESIFQHISEIQLQQSGQLRKILLDPPSVPRDIW